MPGEPRSAGREAIGGRPSGVKIAPDRGIRRIPANLGRCYTVRPACDGPTPQGRGRRVSPAGEAGMIDRVGGPADRGGPLGSSEARTEVLPRGPFRSIETDRPTTTGPDRPAAPAAPLPHTAKTWRTRGYDHVESHAVGRPPRAEPRHAHARRQRPGGASTSSSTPRPRHAHPQMRKDSMRDGIAKPEETRSRFEVPLAFSPPSSPADSPVSRPRSEVVVVAEGSREARVAASRASRPGGSQSQGYQRPCGWRPAAMTRARTAPVATAATGG